MNAGYRPPGRRMVTASLWRHADFMKLWAGQTVSELGSVVTRTAVPLVALLVLGAGPFEMALIVVSASLAVLLVGLFAGAWVDRLRRRPLLIWADAIRAVLLFSIPAAYLADVLRIEYLYVVVFLEGSLGALFHAAYPAYVPSLIGVDRVLEGNSKLATSSSLAEIGGPGLAGGLVQLIGAPFAILVDAISFGVSAISLGLIRRPEPARPARTVAHADSPRDPRGPATRRPAPVARPADAPLGHRARCRLVLRRPLHDLPHRGPAPQPAPARYRRVGRRGRLARRLGPGLTGDRAGWASAPPSSGRRSARRSSVC